MFLDGVGGAGYEVEKCGSPLLLVGWLGEGGECRRRGWDRGSPRACQSRKRGLVKGDDGRGQFADVFEIESGIVLVLLSMVGNVNERGEAVP